jgi:hypothetical protein
MNKKEFIKTLKSDSPSKELKLECCQFFIDNYPIQIEKGVNPFTGEFMTDWTKLDVKIKGGSDKSINFAFNQLIKRIKELEDYEKK